MSKPAVFTESVPRNPHAESIHGPTDSMAAQISAPLQMLQGELNRLIEDFWNPARVGPSHASPVDLDPAAWTPAIDLVETPDETVLMADLPGADPASVDVSLTGNVLTLRGTKAQDPIPDGQSLMQERQFARFHRQVVLSNDVNFDAAQAEFRHGVLRVRLPKKEAAKPRTIPIQTS